VGPRKSDGKSRARRYCGCGWMFRRPKWGGSWKKRPSTATDHPSSADDPPRYADASTQSSLETLPKIAAQIDPHDFDLGELVKRYRDERSRIKAYERGAGTSSAEISQEGSGTANKE
jgi:hypothetical protein